VHARRSTAIVALLAALAAAATAGARSSFTGNVCGLVSARQIATIPGLSSRCTTTRPSRGPGSTIFTGNWAGKTPSSPHLQVTIAAYADQGALQLAKRNLKQGFPGGAPRKVPGIGSAAYEATGAGAIGLHLSVGKYVAYLILTGGSNPRRSSASLETLAKSIAARL
jgi:hypothetical protein